MMREMRRKDRQLPEAEAVRLLESCRFGVLCTVCADGTPYGIPMNHVLDGHILYMHCASAGGLKLENIARSPRACFTVVGGTGLREEAAKEGAGEGSRLRPRSAVAFGSVRILTDETEKLHGLDMLRRGRPRSLPADAGVLQKVHVLRFDIEQLTGKGR